MTEPDPKALDELFTRVLHSEDDAPRAARESAAAADTPAIESVGSTRQAAVAPGADDQCQARAGHSAGWPATAPSTWPVVVVPRGTRRTLELKYGKAEVARMNFEHARRRPPHRGDRRRRAGYLARLAERGETFDMFFY